MVQAGYKVKNISELMLVPESTIRGWVKKQRDKEAPPQEQKVFQQEDMLEDPEVGFLFIHEFYNHRDELQFRRSLASLEHA